ncbi:MAG: hypothetical protein LBC57_02575 [Treponema sp.]|jgi:hypothetical protein|nr:hypothetical protein [Treponema sp.]
MKKKLILMAGMLALALTFVNAQSSDFQVLSASGKEVKIKVINDTKLYSVALAAGSQTYEAGALANEKGDVRWANGSRFWAGSSLPMPKEFGVGAMQLTADSEIVFSEFGAPDGFTPEQIMILTEPEAKPIYLRKP